MVGVGLHWNDRLIIYTVLSIYVDNLYMSLNGTRTARRMINSFIHQLPLKETSWNEGDQLRTENKMKRINKRSGVVDFVKRWADHELLWPAWKTRNETPNKIKSNTGAGLDIKKRFDIAFGIHMETINEMFQTVTEIIDQSSTRTFTYVLIQVSTILRLLGVSRARRINCMFVVSKTPLANSPGICQRYLKNVMKSKYNAMKMLTSQPPKE